MMEWLDVGDILPAHLHASTDRPYTRADIVPRPSWDAGGTGVGHATLAEM